MAIQNKHWTKALAKLAKEQAEQARKEAEAKQAAARKVPPAHLDERPKRRFVVSRVVNQNQLALPAPENTVA